jgi:hypothetical protein
MLELPGVQFVCLLLFGSHKPSASLCVYTCVASGVFDHVVVDDHLLTIFLILCLTMFTTCFEVVFTVFKRCLQHVLTILYYLLVDVYIVLTMCTTCC